MRFYTYKITCFVTGRIYFGFTSQTIEERFRQHETAAYRRKSHPLGVLAAIAQHSIENFSIEQVGVFDSEQEALDHEVALICEYRTNVFRYPDSNGMNLNDGGAKPPMDDEIRKMISKAHRGKSLCAEHRQKISETMKGKPHPKVPMSREHATSIGQAHKGRVKSNDHKSNLRSALLGRRYSQERIIAIFENGDRQEFATGREAAKSLNLSRSTISGILSGRLKQRSHVKIERLLLSH